MNATPFTTPVTGMRGRIKNVLAALKHDDAAQSAWNAFEKDMQPVCNAIVGALKQGDMEALRGLRALLPHLLAEVNADPALADVLSFQLGKSLVEGLTAKPEEVL